MAIVVMGVAGSGKTSVGEGIGRRLGIRFRDADEFHPSANVAKMSAGIPLDDADRWPWLDAIGKAIHDAGDESIVVACSALKRVYRDRIVKAAGRPIEFVFLDGSLATLRKRIGGRRGHFMPASLLDSQLATLERPTSDERVITVSIEQPVDQVVSRAIEALGA
ncbi:MAG TPA: gluconokinase [Bauldia sp.]|nr:gluconokinase [Bauldia sp.]